MTKLICSRCQKVVTPDEHGACPICHGDMSTVYPFHNSDGFLREQIPPVLEERKRLGLDGLVGGLEAVILNTEPEHQQAAAQELLCRTGFTPAESFEDNERSCITLERAGSADLVIQSRKDANPFLELNRFPKAEHLPNTRIETFVFAAANLKEYVSIQRGRGVEFLNDSVIDAPDYYFIQTAPSRFTHNSIGLVQWKDGRGSWATGSAEPLQLALAQPDKPYLANIGRIDHAATRVHAEERDAAIIEFMRLTNYNFDFAIYVSTLNSITNVARLSAEDYAMVFTSGIIPYNKDAEPGPTERFIHNYGPRVHHLAFDTENVENVYASLMRDGVEFLIELVGSPEEGLKQTFTMHSLHTLVVNEYIHRYGDFDGFFTRSNVTDLTRATTKQ
jgi:4-hydroxyphenylpyruvate dioxygenase-like putative hemolysin